MPSQMRLPLLVMLVVLPGCAVPVFSGKQVVELRNSVIVKNELLARREQEIRELILKLEQAEESVKAKDAEVQALKEKLRNFGVF